MRSALPILLLVFAVEAEANLIEDAVTAMDDGRVYLEFASREGVYGDGRSMITYDDHGILCDCDEGPARVQIRMRRGQIRELKVSVGGRVRGLRDGDVDLGEVPVPAAREYLLGLARTAREAVAQDAVRALSLADDDTLWRDLLALARTHEHPRIRRSAIFWLAQHDDDPRVLELFEEILLDR